MNNIQNNISFSGLYLPKGMNMSKATINKFSDIVEKCEPFADKFEKQYNVDLHLDLNMDKIEFVHKEYGNLNRFGKEEFSVA